MKKITLGKTGLKVSKEGFGALPIQRISTKEAVKILKTAYEAGMNFFDTARFYTDSEEKLASAFKDIRSNIIIASKTGAKDKDTFWKDLKTSLNNLNTDCIDIYQFHNPPFVPLSNSEDGLYSAMVEAKDKGYIRHIGISCHKLEVAIGAVNSGFYDTVQYPINILSSSKELELVKLCKDKNVGLIAMKALSGGLIKRAELSYAFLNQFDNVVPIWGFQKINELNEILEFDKNPPILNEVLLKDIAKEKEDLSGQFCRGCGYCMPCPAGIEINWCARMSLLLRRAPSKRFTEPEWVEKMKKIENCTLCKSCITKCPYGLDVPELLKENYNDYMQFIKS